MKEIKLGAQSAKAIYEIERKREKTASLAYAQLHTRCRRAMREYIYIRCQWTCLHASRALLYAICHARSSSSTLFLALAVFCSLYPTRLFSCSCLSLSLSLSRNCMRDLYFMRHMKIRCWMLNCWMCFL